MGSNWWKVLRITRVLTGWVRHGCRDTCISPTTTSSSNVSLEQVRLERYFSRKGLGFWVLVTPNHNRTDPYNHTIVPRYVFRRLGYTKFAGSLRPTPETLIPHISRSPRNLSFHFLVHFVFPFVPTIPYPKPLKAEDEFRSCKP